MKTISKIIVQLSNKVHLNETKQVKYKLAQMRQPDAGNRDVQETFGQKHVYISNAVRVVSIFQSPG